MYVCTYVCIYIYIEIEREREREITICNILEEQRCRAPGARRWESGRCRARPRPRLPDPPSLRGTNVLILIYIYIYTHTCVYMICLSLSLYIYIYICMCVSLSLYLSLSISLSLSLSIYIYIYIYISDISSGEVRGAAQFRALGCHHTHPRTLYIYIYIYMYTYICMYVCVHIYIYIYVCMYIHIYIYIYTYICTYMHIYTLHAPARMLGIAADFRGSSAARVRPHPPLYIPQRGVQWKEGVVICMVLRTSLFHDTTPIHCTPLPLHPPSMSIHPRPIRSNALPQLFVLLFVRSSFRCFISVAHPTNDILVSSYLYIYPVLYHYHICQ